MNRKQLILLLAVLAVLGGAGWVLLQRNKQSWTAPKAKLGDKVLPNFRYNDVASVRIQAENAELNIVYTNGLWRLPERNNYPANIHLLSDLLIKMRDLKVVQAETVAPSQLGRVNLAEPGHGAISGTLLEFKDAQGKTLDSLLVGKKHLREQNASNPFGNRGLFDGCYILARNNPTEVILVSDELSTTMPSPAIWLSKDFIKAEKVKSISLAATNPADSWKLSRETESIYWTLADARPGEIVDTNFATVTARMLPYLSFVDVLPANNAPEQCGLDHPQVVTIETFDHFTYTLKIGAKTQDYYFLTVAVAADLTPEQKSDSKVQEKLKLEQSLAPWIYVANSATLEALLRDRARILVNKKDERLSSAKS